MGEETNSPVSTFIIDSEVIAYDTKAKKLLPFQVLSTRSRKACKEEDVTIQVICCPFDLLFLNGESYLRRSLRERRAALHKHFREVEGKLRFAEHREMSEVDE